MARPLPLAPLAWLVVASALPAFGSLPPAAVSTLNITKSIESQRSGDFSILIESWKKLPKSVRARQWQELQEVALNAQLAERTRYIALMGAAELARTPDEVRQLNRTLQILKKDRNWLIRSATLNVARRAAPGIALELLADRALVIRSQAVDVVLATRPKGAAQALAAAALDPNNYSGGKPLWVPQKALKALAALNPAEALQISKKLGPNPKLTDVAQAWQKAAITLR